MPDDLVFVNMVRDRGKKMTARAAEKYGPTAISPTGDPTRDVFDYCINELAGVPRYVEMMRNRLEEMPVHYHAYERGKSLLRRLESEASHHAFLLERYRAELLELGMELGEAETI